MKSLNTRTWTVVGVALLVLTTLVLGLYVGQLLPVPPKPLPQDTETNKFPGADFPGTTIAAVNEVDVAFGSELVIESATDGFDYTYPDLAMFDAMRAPAEFQPYLSFNYGSFALSVSETKVITGDAFTQWYPEAYLPGTSDVPLYRGSELPGKAFLVTVKATNLSQSESLRLPNLMLWSADFNQVSDVMGSGAYPSALLKPFLYPDNYDVGSVCLGSITYGATSNAWLDLAPGDAREIVFPYYVYENSFADRAAYENIDLAKFCIEVNDFDPGIRYRFWMG